MPDMKTAMSAALAKEISNWDNEEKQRTEAPKGRIYFKIANNVARETFNMVKNNPGLTAPDYVERLAKLGFKESSTTSIISQLVRGGQFARNNATRTLVVAQPEYSPIKNLSKKVKPLTKPREKAEKPRNTHQSSAGIAALPAQDEVKAAKAVLAKKEWAPEDVINALTLPQAKQLWRALQEYFG